MVLQLNWSPGIWHILASSSQDTRCMKSPEICFISLWNVRSKFPALGISEKCRSEGSKNDITLRTRKYKNKALILLNEVQNFVNHRLKLY